MKSGSIIGITVTIACAKDLNQQYLNFNKIFKIYEKGNNGDKNKERIDIIIYWNFGNDLMRHIGLQRRPSFGFNTTTLFQ